MELIVNVPPLVNKGSLTLMNETGQWSSDERPERILLLKPGAENDEESVATFAEKLNMKDPCYMLAEAGDSLERQSLKNAWKKLWPDLEGEKNFNDDHREEITDFCPIDCRISRM
ncbi:hypothetical protein TNCV_2355251 [Trichonephila clavipes]|nr:hypothetical protein TNCV_2355251 [Trichonephila clavipes]